MPRYTGSPLALCAAISLMVSVAGCGEEARETGTANVSAVLGATPGQVERVTLSISGGSLAAPLVQDLTRVDDTHYFGTVADVPAGAGYTFLVEAFGGTPETVRYRGQATGVAIGAGQIAQVTIVLLEVAPPPGPEPQAPIIDGLASGSTVVPGAVVRVYVIAHSPEGHALTYEWQAGGCGSFADAAQPSTAWTAPANEAVCQLSVRVADGTNATSVTGHLVVVVRAPRASADVQTTLDTYPVLTLTADEHVVIAEPAPPGLSVGITADVVLTASDPDSDPLTVAWSSSCGGTFSPSAAAATIRFHHDDPAAKCTLTVEVSDGRGAVTGGSVALSGFTRATAAAVATGYLHSLAVKTDGTLWAWGFDEYGQLGYWDAPYHPWSPGMVGTGFASVAAGHEHTVALKTDGTVWAWGWNAYGQIGDGTMDVPSARPVQVGTDFASVAAGYAHTVAVKLDGTLWAWGLGVDGQIGDGTDTSRPFPVRIGTGFVSADAGLVHTVAVKADGTLWAWGGNEGGELGDGTLTSRNSPVQIGTGFRSVAAGYYHTLAVQTDGTLWAWGANGYGELGDGTNIDRISPVRIGAGFSSVAVGEYSSLAVKTDGTLWAWGPNYYGGTFVEYQPSPVQIGTGFVSVAAGAAHNLAVKTDGTLWAWGVNYYGELGDGTGIERPSPVRIDF